MSFYCSEEPLRRKNRGLSPNVTIDTRLLWSDFLESSRRFPNHVAIEVAGHQISYRELAQRAQALAATIQKGVPYNPVPLTGIFAYRSETAYVGVLGVLMAGHGYVPLNRTFPIDRTRLMLEKSMCGTVVVDTESEPQLEKILLSISHPLLIICPDRENVTELAKKLPKHQVIGAGKLCQREDWATPEVEANSIAYLLFTSGSTGQPKGVMVSHSNVVHYLDYVTKRYEIASSDRLSQTFDLTFDLSAHDLFVTWASGACLCVPSQKQMIKPGRFINEAGLTGWFSVPSTATFMRRFGELKPGAYPHLRLSLFCGEALPIEIVRDWSAAAPNSMIENIYGPTELTIACTAYRWDNQTSPGECEHGIVPIGEPFENMQALIVDEQLHEVENGVDGELLMTGPQLSLGYWQDEKRTRDRFVSVPNKDGTYYRTGDRVRRRDSGKQLLYLGRLDNQVKILGHRVELGEVEAAVREVSGIPAVVAVGWPPTASGAAGIEVFVEVDQVDAQAILGQLKSKLPAYMVPSGIRPIKRFPLNPNGKYDRKALTAVLEPA
jgi:amino acid adenylation domain-containing protein